MAIERTGVRLTIAEQLSRNVAFRGKPLALELRDHDLTPLLGPL